MDRPADERLSKLRATRVMPQLRRISGNEAGIGRLVRFACIGGIGFALDAGILTLLVNGLGWGVYLARAVSFCTAVTGTWYANRSWVFDCIRGAREEYSRYFAVQTAGAGLNLCVYVALIQCLPSLAAAPVVPLAAGAGLALLFNYFAAARFVFRSSAI